MIIRDLDIEGVAVLPPKANAPLFVNSNAALPFAVTHQFLQSVAWQRPQVFEGFGSVEDHEFSECGALELSVKPLYTFTIEKAFSQVVVKAPEHSIKHNVTR